MGTIGAGEILVIALIALIVLGPDKLPEAARKVGQVIAEVRKVSSGFQAELRDALHEPVDSTPPTSGTTIKRSPTPKAQPAPPPDPDAGTADGAAIDPSDWYGGTDRPGPVEADASSNAGPDAHEAPDGPGEPGASPPTDGPADPGDRAA